MKRNFGHEDAGLATPETLDSIVKNFNIRAFLETNDKRYLVGPKGSGKTLLLLRKAIDQRAKGEAICVPSDPGSPVDRLTAAQHVGRQFNYSVSDESESNLAWASVWKHSIYRSVLHHFRDHILSEIGGASLSRKGNSWQESIEYSHLRASRKLLGQLLSDVPHWASGPYYYYTELGAKLDASRRSGLQTVREEITQLESLLKIVRQPIYVFLDNLDDYYEREPELWFNSMYGQFRAVREISLAQRHIHIFTSIRQDVYQQFADEMRLQYYDYVTHLRYTKEELLNIFESHIQELDDDLLEVPEARREDPWRAFFGGAVMIPNEVVGVEETIQDYIRRHTLDRPRDLIHMGTVLLARRPYNGFDLDSVRDAVIAAEEDIAEQYLAEIRPLLDQRFNIKELIKNFVTSNVLSRGRLDEIKEAFIRNREDLFNRDAASDLTRPFETLYQLGLFGYAKQRPDTNRVVQHFRSPGQGLSPPEERELLESELYFLHPVLNNWLPRKCRSGRMVVGNELPVPEI